MHNIVRKSNGARNWVATVAASALLAVGGLTACGTNSHTVSSACAAEMTVEDSAFTVVLTKPNPPAPRYKAPSVPKAPRQQSNTSSNKTTPNKQVPKAPTGQNSTSGGSSSGSSGSGSSSVNRVPKPPMSNTRVTAPGESAYTPPRNNVRQPQADIRAAQQSVSGRRFIARQGSTYRSPVTGHAYRYHPRGYYLSHSHYVYQDIYNMWDPRNYRSSGVGTLAGHWSPFWLMAWNHTVVAHC